MSDELFTPGWIFEALGLRYDLDVASSANPYVVVPADRYFTKDDDALNQDWLGRVWLNPPFSKVTPWIEKWLEHANGFCLVPLASNGKWISTLWQSDAQLTYLPTNMAFIGGQDGIPVKHRWRCSLWAIGDENIQSLKASGIGKVR